MDEKFAVYTVVVEDTEEAFRRLVESTVEHRLIQDDLAFLDAEVVNEELGVM